MCFHDYYFFMCNIALLLCYIDKYIHDPSKNESDYRDKVMQTTLRNRNNLHIWFWEYIIW